jgi:hypothetical protein
MKLKKVHGFGKEFDIDVQRETGKIRLVVKSSNHIIFNKLIEDGSSQKITL